MNTAAATAEKIAPVAAPLTREAWMQLVAEELRPVFASLDAPLPAFRVTMSLTKGKRVIGTCFDKSVSKDGVYEILIRLDQADPLDVAAVLAHELVHAAVGIAAGHGPAFGRVARALGLEGKLTATEPGDAFKAMIAPILEKVGPFPHAALAIFDRDAPRSGPKRQTCRQLKCSCEECGYTCRTTRKWIDDVGAPHCPRHGEMIVDGEEN